MMSSEANYVASLRAAQINLFKFGGPILMSIGTVSCVLNLIVFTKKTLRKNPCSIYLVAFNVSNFLLIYTSLLITTLVGGYSIDPSLQSVSFCHFRFYTLLLFSVLYPFYSILASIGRVLFTSQNVRTRQRSTPRLAYICIMSVTLFWLLAQNQTLFLANILQPATHFFVCYFQLEIYLVFVGYYSVIIKGILIHLLMIIFGVWTVKNIRKIGRVASVHVLSNSGTTATGGLSSTHSKDRQLIKILLVDISVYIIFSLMISIFLMYQQLTQYQSKSYIQNQPEALLLAVGTFSSYIPFLYRVL